MYGNITLFMNTKNNVVEVDRKSEFKSIGIKRNSRSIIIISNSNDTSLLNLKVAVCCSDSSYAGIQSAIFLFQKGGASSWFKVPVFILMAQRGRVNLRSSKLCHVYQKVRTALPRKYTNFSQEKYFGSARRSVLLLTYSTFRLASHFDIIMCL